MNIVAQPPMNIIEERVFLSDSDETIETTNRTTEKTAHRREHGSSQQSTTEVGKQEDDRGI